MPSGAMDDPQTQTSLNIPSLVAFAVISFFAIRYLFFTPASSSATSNSTSSGGQRQYGRNRVPQDRIEQVVAMFPQLGRREVEWDLLHNGGSVQATTERALREGWLPAPPPNFQAQFVPAVAAAATAAAAAASSSNRRGQPAQIKPNYTDLITRYNLSSRVSSSKAAGASDAGATEETLLAAGKQQEKGGWSANKVERQALLKRRREEMILAARRKMEERDRKEKGEVSA